MRTDEQRIKGAHTELSRVRTSIRTAKAEIKDCERRSKTMRHNISVDYEEYCRLAKKNDEYYVDDAMKVCFAAGIKVYPVRIGSRWQIEMKLNSATLLFDKKLAESKINKNVVLTYAYLADKLKKHLYI